MPQTLIKIYMHIIFATYNHAETLPKQNLHEVHAYIGGILNNLNCTPLIIGGTASHIHVLCQFTNSFDLSKVMQTAKAYSSKWLKATYPQCHSFRWQGGFSAMSVSASNVERVREYICNQETHHKKVGYLEELEKWAKAYCLDFDERYQQD